MNAKCAKEMAQVIARDFDERLDFSLASLKVVDDILLKMKSRKEKVSLELVVGIGCYAGEVLIRHTGGQWVCDEGQALVEVPNVGTANPIGKCWKRLQNGKSDGVEMLVRTAMAMQGHRPDDEPQPAVGGEGEVA